MKRLCLPVLTIVFGILLVSSNADEGKGVAGKTGWISPARPPQEGEGGSRGYAQLNIPKEHYPAPGECRIWYPDRPVALQPPPDSCERIKGKVPPGSLLIRSLEDDLDHVYVIAYDEQRPGIVRSISKFEIESGVLVRIIYD